MTDRDVGGAGTSRANSNAIQFYGAQQLNYHRGFNPYDPTRSQHSINFITEDFLAGFMQDGRMSVVRRFFCLFVTFDLVFISLLWIICVMITGDNIYNALTKQVLHYTIYTSLFDIVVAALCRFCILVLVYGLLYVNHWSIVALCTAGSCFCLITKVFYYDWSQTPQPVFEVLLVIVSFVLSWGEAWFLDCRVIPQESHARNYFIAATQSSNIDERSPLLAPFLQSVHNYRVGPESIGNFYSPIDSAHNSDDDDNMDDEYCKMGLEAVRRSYDLLESKDWKIEKVTQKNDTIQSLHRDGLGKIYRLTARVNCSAQRLTYDLFYNIEDVPKWNPTLLESKFIHKINSHTDITYQATTGGPGGVVKARDFVNLRCWQLIRDGKIVENAKLNIKPSSVLRKHKNATEIDLENKLLVLAEKENEDDADDESEENSEKNESFDVSFQSRGSSKKLKKSMSEQQLNDSNKASTSLAITPSLSKSLGAKDFNNSDQNLSDDDLTFVDARDVSTVSTESNQQNDVYLSAGISVVHHGTPPVSKYIRGENLVSCWAMREIPNQPEWCIFEWLLCLDLKGYMPRYVLDTAYTSLMQDYMKFLREYCKQINHKTGEVPENQKTHV